MADPDQAGPEKLHGDPLLNAAQGSGDVHGTRHGLPPEAAAEDAPAEDAPADPAAAPDTGSDQR